MLWLCTMTLKSHIYKNDLISNFINFNENFINRNERVVLHGTTPGAVIALRSFKSIKHINEKGDGPYRFRLSKSCQ